MMVLLCLQHPWSCWSPVLMAGQGGDICYTLDWVNLALGHYSGNNLHLAVQAWDTPSAWHHVLSPLSIGFIIGWWVLPMPCQCIHCPRLTTQWLLPVVIACHNINGRKCFKMPLQGFTDAIILCAILLRKNYPNVFISELFASKSRI